MSLHDMYCRQFAQFIAQLFIAFVFQLMYQLLYSTALFIVKPGNSLKERRFSDKELSHAMIFGAGEVNYRQIAKALQTVLFFGLL